MVTREPEYFPPANSYVAQLGRYVLFFCRAVGQGTLLLWHAILASRYVLTKRTRDEVVMQMFAYGIKSLGVITVVGLFTGMILALQTGMALSQLLSSSWLPSKEARSSRVVPDESLSRPRRPPGAPAMRIGHVLNR